MIKTRKQFEERLKKMKKEKVGDYLTDIIRSGYNRGLDDVLKLIEDEGGCFKE